MLDVQRVSGSIPLVSTTPKETDNKLICFVFGLFCFVYVSDSIFLKRYFEVQNGITRYKKCSHFVVTVVKV